MSENTSKIDWRAHGVKIVNLEIAPAEPPEEVLWTDDIHRPETA